MMMDKGSFKLPTLRLVQLGLLLTGLLDILMMSITFQISHQFVVTVLSSGMHGSTSRM